jgi:hypothetical protein
LGAAERTVVSGGLMESNRDWWTLGMIVLVLAILSLPRWRYSRSWGYYPFGVLVIVLFILIVMMALRVPPPAW